MDDYTSTKIPEIQDYKLSLNYAITYLSDDNGKLDNATFALLKGGSDLEVYQIENKIRSLLSAFYTTENIDEMIEMKTGFMYNSDVKVITDQLTRDVTIGISSEYIKLEDITNISDEF